MSQISCNVCMDLIPLVKDGIASEDSRALVMEHIACCEQCAKVWGEGIEDPPVMDEKLVLHKIKRQLMLFSIVVVLAGMLIGMMLSDGMGMFYNGIIMPMIGCFGYFLLHKKAHYMPIGVFLFSFVWVSIREIFKGFLSYAAIGELLVMSAWWSAIFAGFCMVGVVIGALLHYAFRKER